jgi:hypothetical protein
MSETKQDTAAERLLRAALDFCEQDEILRNLRKALRPCEFWERPDYAVGDNGVPVCRQVPEFDEGDWCEPCKQRKANEIDQKLARKSRRLAKQRMVRWARRAGATADQAEAPRG